MKFLFAKKKRKIILVASAMNQICRRGTIAIAKSRNSSEESKSDAGNDPASDESEQEIEGPNFDSLFAMWAITWGICQNAIDALLAIFRLFP